MGVSSCRRARSSYGLLFAALLVAAVSGARGASVHAQELPPAQRWDGLIELISGRYPWAPPVTEPPTPADGPSQMSRHAVSGDGRYIIFTAEAPNLGFSTPALYIRDRRTNETNVLLGGQVRDAAFSADANHVAFTICDPWMRPDFLEICDVWSLDTRSWTWSLMSRAPDDMPGDADSGEPVLSANGRFVVFRTKAANLTNGGPAGVTQIVLRDRDTDGNGVFDEPGTSLLETISVGSSLVPGNGSSESAEVSDDGRFVAFRSIASNLVAGDTNDVWDVFYRDRQVNATTRLNLRPQDLESPVSIDSPAISMSAEGQWIAFTSADGLLGQGAIDDTNNVRDVYVYHAGAGTLRRIDIGDAWPAAGGFVPGNGAASWPSLSADGRYVAFESAATNVALPPTPGTTQVYVFDLGANTASRVSLKPNGDQPDADCVRPMISADGSLVAFTSQALNLSGNVTTPFDRVYAAVHFEIGPSEVFVSGGVGVTGTFTITTQQHTQWWVDWNNLSNWVGFDSTPFSVGSGDLRLSTNSPNMDPAPRSATIRIFDHSVVFTQSAGLSITSVSPTSGPVEGGTPVTVRGTGFEPGMDVQFDGVYASSTLFVDDTTLVATTPAHPTGTVWVGIVMPDGRNAWIDQAFHYNDPTPPLIWPGVDGVATAEGWYQTDVTVIWWYGDPESEVTSATGCGNTVVNTDTAGVTFTCTVTSEGGTASASVTIKRDTQAPSITVTTPTSTIYELNSSIVGEVSCADALSGVQHCSLPGSGMVDTSSPGWHQVFAQAADNATNVSFAEAVYAVSNGVCSPVPPDLRLWFEFENSARDSVHGSLFGMESPSFPPAAYVPGKVGQAFSLPGWQFFSFAHQLEDLQFTNAMTFAGWVKAEGQTGEAGTIASKEDQFRIAQFPDGTIRWAFANAETNFAWVNTGVMLPQGVWAHLVVSYDQGTVRTYVNGQLMHTHNGSGNMQPIVGLPFWGRWLSLGNRHDPAHNSVLIGAIDEVQLVAAAWDQPLVDNSFFGGAQGMCKLTPTVILASSTTAIYGSTSFPARAQLRVAETQQPIAGKPVRLVSRVTLNGSVAGTVTLTTDENGWVEWNAPKGADAPTNTYQRGIEAFFDADFEHGGSTGLGVVTVEPGMPVVTWPTPAAITYGTPITETQQNATANVPGLFSYGQSPGTVLPAGQHLLTLLFDPDNVSLPNVNASVALEVLKADPVLTWDSPAAIGYGSALGSAQLNATANVPGTWSYVPAAGTVLGAGSGQTLTATFTPTSDNYNSKSITTTIDVLKAAPIVTVTGGTFTYDGQPHAATASATGVTGEVLGPIEITYDGFPTAPTQAGTYAVVATFAGNANYEPASATTTLTIEKATPTLTWITPAGIVYGTALGESQLNAASNVPGTFIYKPGLGTILTAGNAQTLTAVFTPADAANYESGSVQTTIDVAKRTPTVTIAGGSFTYDGAPHPATGSVIGIGEELGPLVFTYNGSTNVPVNSGSYAVVGTYDGNANYGAASGTATIVIAKAASGLTWNHPGAIVYGAALGASQLNATSNVPGTFAYLPAAGTVLNAGNGQLLSATFTPADATNYTGGSVQTTIDVVRAPLTVRANDGSKPFGAPLPLLTASANGFVNGDSMASLSGTLALWTPATPQSPVGVYPIVPSGVSSPNYAIAFMNGALSVVRGSVDLTVTTSPSPTGFDQPMTFTAMVSAATPAAGQPTGVVQFFDGATLVGSATLSDGVASISTAGLDAGMHTIEARYAGDGSFESGDRTASHVVLDGASTASISITSSKNPSNVGQTVTLTANVNTWSGPVSGAVEFYSGSTLLGSGSLVSGRATLTTDSLPAASHVITVRYLGVADIPPSVSGVFVQAVGGPGWKDRTTTMTLTSAENPSTLGDAVVFVATVTGTWSSAPTGRILFMVNGQVVADVPVTTISDTAARATFTVNGLNHGRHKVSATYQGDPLYKGSTMFVTQTVN